MAAAEWRAQGGLRRQSLLGVGEDLGPGCRHGQDAQRGQSAPQGVATCLGGGGGGGARARGVAPAVGRRGGRRGAAPAARVPWGSARAARRAPRCGGRGGTSDPRAGAGRGRVYCLLPRLHCAVGCIRRAARPRQYSVRGACTYTYCVLAVCSLCADHVLAGYEARMLAMC